MIQLSKIVCAVIFFLNTSCIFSQNECSELIKKIKADSEWNLVNYFKDIDLALKSQCSERDKITLLLLKGWYYNNIGKINESLNVTTIAQKKLKYIDDRDSLAALIHLRKSGSYAQLNMYFESYQEWNKCNNYYLLTKNYDGLAFCQLLLVNIHLSLKQPDYAYKAAIKAKKYAFVNHSNRVLKYVYSSFSAYWATRSNLDSAIYYLRLVESTNKFGEIDLTTDFNKGVLYLNKDDIENARLFFQKTINDAQKVHCRGSEGQGKYGLALTYIDSDPKKAFSLMKEALYLIDKYNPDLGINICECILDNFKGKEYDALVSFFKKRSTVFKDKKHANDQIQVGKIFNLNSSMNEELLAIQKQLETKKDNEVEQNKKITALYITGFFILVILLVSLYFFRVISKSKKLLEEQNSQQKILLNNSIVAITNYNAISESLAQKLKHIALETPSKKLSDQLYELVKNINEAAVGAKSKELKDLDLVIQSVNDGFVKRLCHKFPNLTSNEVTLAIYLRMNFNTKQIADLKGSSENSIDVARSRLRSKLGIKGDMIDLSIFMNKI